MKSKPTAKAAASLRRKLTNLRQKRRELKKPRGQRRRTLTSKQRSAVLAKTAGHCHICGGKIRGRWEADHVKSHAMGGSHVEDNYLPAHSLCNNYRWHYLPEEFQYLLKIGIWARTQIEKGTPLGMEIAGGFAKHELRREIRRVSTP